MNWKQIKQRTRFSENEAFKYYRRCVLELMNWPPERTVTKQIEIDIAKQFGSLRKQITGTNHKRRTHEINHTNQCK